MTHKTEETGIDTRGAFKLNMALDKLFGRGTHSKRDWAPNANRAPEVMFTTIRRRDPQQQLHAAPAG